MSNTSTTPRNINVKRKLNVALLVFMIPISALVHSAQMEDVLVTGTYFPQQNSDLSASISVLETQTLQALNKRNLADLLKTIPGVSVEEQGGPGGLTAVSIRGGETNFTLVLLDGVPLNDPTNSRGGSFDFANLDPASVERIEIVRGPQSAVYGSDALSGVINIITKRGREGHRQKLRMEGGEDNLYNLNLDVSGEVGALRYSANLGKRDEGKQLKGSSRETENIGLRLDWQPIEDHEFTLSYRYLDGQRTSYPEQSGGAEFALSNALDRSEYEDQTLYLGWQADVSETWHSSLTASYFEHDEIFDSPGIIPFNAVPPNATDTDFKRYQLQWVNTIQIVDLHQLSLGADYRYEDGVSNGFLDFGFFQLPTEFELDRSTTGLFLEINSRPIESLLLQGSVRYDKPEDFNSETSIKLGASYQLNPLLNLLVNWGEAFKLPSFFALGHSLVGNPNLKPETARSWDIGLKWTPLDEFEVTATYFFDEYQDLIDFDPALFTNVNRSRVESKGLELQFNWMPSEKLSVLTQVTYTDIDVKDSSSILLNRPEWKAGITALWNISKDWSTALDYQWTGEQYASSLYTGASVVQTLDDYHRVDLNLSWQISKSVRVGLALENLLDEDYQTAVGFSGPDRSARFNVTFESVHI